MRKYNQLSRSQLATLTPLGRGALDAVVFGDYPQPEEQTPPLELTMIWYRGDLFPKLQCSHDIFLVFDKFNDLFIELGKRQDQPLTPQDFCTLLDNLDFQDETPEIPWQKIHVTLQSPLYPLSVA